MRALNKATIKIPEVEISIFALRDHYTESDIDQWEPMSVSVCNTLGPAVFGFAPDLLRKLVRSKIDVLHVHGIWMYPSVAALGWSKASSKPYIISPHGMLDPWAISHSHWKKQLAHAVYEGAHLRGAACLRALCSSEAESMRIYGLSNPIAIIPNGVDLPDLATPTHSPSWASRLPREAKVLFFLGRLHPKKGLANFLHAWAQASQSEKNGLGVWHIVIAGWEQGGHQAELEQLAVELGVRSTVHFVGPQFDAEKVASFMRVNAFILPSFSEGLPMAVLEAWSYSLPVLMTPQCNLPEGFAAGAAIEISPEVSSIVKGLHALFLMDDAMLQAMGNRGRNLVEARFSWPTIGEEMVNVYRWMLGQAPQPHCVRME